MTRQEIARTLALMAIYDRRIIDETTVIAWIPMLDDIAFTEANTAIIDHYKTNSDWITPADLRSRVADQRRQAAESRRAQIEHVDAARRADPTCGNPNCRCSHTNCYHGQIKQPLIYQRPWKPATVTVVPEVWTSCPDCDNWAAK